MILRLITVGFVLAFVAQPAWAQGGAQPASAQQNPQADTPTFEEQVVVSASRVEQELVNAPAAVSVVTGDTIKSSPATNIGDLLRAVPGLNVTQVSARDINLTTRGATSTLSTSQLALVDGRSIYLDFFGMVMWDLVPSNLNDVKQIEVIRGPASAVWGANAMSGVVNVITYSPRELAQSGRGSSVTIGFGGFNRDVTGRDQDGGSLFYVNGSHAGAVNDRWSYKLAAGYLTQDPMPRPTGVLPNTFKTPYPDFINEGTSQPKFDARVDYDLANNAGRLTFSGGVAATEGIIHSGIGPFNISNDSRMAYLTTRYAKGSRRVAFFANLLDGDATNLLARTPTGAFLPLVFDTKTFDIDAADVRAVGSRNALSFGGNFRHNTFDISLAPAGDNRNEGGAYLQDEILLSDQFRWVIGGRVDKFSSIDSAVFSPRTTFMYKPAASQTLRVSFNRAFRAPSFINNNINTTILNNVNLAPFGVPPALAQFVFPISAVGNPDLEPERMTAYEIGYTGVIRRRATVSAAVYWNKTKDGIYFTPVSAYSAANPPPRWPLPPAVLTLLAAANPPVVLPSGFTYLNLGTINDKGVELAVDAAANRYVNVFANYSFQAMPTIEDFQAGTGINDINWPARHRVNAGVNFTYSRYVGNLSVNHTDEAYWQDVLDARFAGKTKPFTLVNFGAGVRWADNHVSTNLKVTNLLNQEMMQHIFGDVLKRQVVGEVRFDF
jgi:outer membrane receptor protein involved in Fe transport